METQGCLAAILRLFGIRLGDLATSRALPYRLRDDFLSRAEHSFYNVLCYAVREQATVLAKVNLGDIFFVAQPGENQSYRNKIDRKHVDFLVCHTETMKPLFGVELDDKSHDRRDRIERDAFVNEVFQAAGLPLVRFPARAAYDVTSIAAELTPYVSHGPAAQPAGPQQRLSGSTPQCPKCGVPMVQRVASKGQNKGNQFWGCPNYPRCREIA